MNLSEEVPQSRVRPYLPLIGPTHILARLNEHPYDEYFSAGDPQWARTW